MSEEKQEVTPVITVKDLQKQYEEISNVKVRLENDYYRILGQLSLLKQQIETLKTNEPKK